MWTARRTVVHAAAVIALLAPTVALSPGAGADDGGQLPPGAFLGVDGLLYEHAPAVVDGADGILFFGEDFDSACAYGHRFPGALKRLQQLARVIERSGRRVVYTVAPNKSAVDASALPAALPHGVCDTLGMDAQNRALDGVRDDDFVATRKALVAAERRGEEVYWKLDTHWTTVGASYYVKELAETLDPRLARRQRYRSGHETILVDLSYLGILGTTYETGPTRFPTTSVQVSPAAGDQAWDPAQMVDVDVAWRSRPAGRTWPGRTVLLGDSFTYRGLGSLMPLFRSGRFMWIGNFAQDDLIAEIRRSDTVVLEVVQRYLPMSVLADRGFRRDLARALRR